MSGIFLVAVLMNGCDDGVPHPWLYEHGNLVEVVQLEGAINSTDTMFVVKSVKTGELTKVVATNKVVLVGEKWEVRQVVGAKVKYIEFKERRDVR